MSTFAQDLSQLRKNASGMTFETLFESFSALCTAHSEELSGLNATYRLNARDTGKVFTLKFDGGAVSELAQDAPADVTLIAAEKDILALIEGKLNPVKAMLTGRLKVKGSLSLLTAFAGFLEE